MYSIECSLKRGMCIFDGPVRPDIEVARPDSEEEPWEYGW